MTRWNASREQLAITLAWRYMAPDQPPPPAKMSKEEIKAVRDLIHEWDKPAITLDELFAAPAIIKAVTLLQSERTPRISNSKKTREQAAFICAIAAASAFDGNCGCPVCIADDMGLSEASNHLAFYAMRDAAETYALDAYTPEAWGAAESMLRTGWRPS